MKRAAQPAQAVPEPELDEHFFMIETPKGSLTPDDLCLVFILRKNGLARWFQPELTASVFYTPQPESSPSLSDSSPVASEIVTQLNLLDEAVSGIGLGSVPTVARHRKGSSDKM